MRLLAKALCVVLLSAAAAPPEEVPSTLALTLMLKVITYDGEFGRHGQGDFVVLVPGDAEATRPVFEAVDQLEHKAILGRRLSFVAVGAGEVEKKANELKASALLAPRGTSAAAAQQLSRLSGSSHLYSLALDPRLVEEGGLMLGVALNAGKPQLVMNVTAARAAGADFKPTVLKIARTVQ
jgi:hypothetical protein